MPSRYISRDLKTRALWMLDTGFLPEEIGYILGVSDRSIRRWVANEAEFGDVIPPHNPLQGRPHALMADQTHAVIETVSAAPEMFLDEVRDYLALERDTLVGITTLHDLILAAGLSYKLLRRQVPERDEMA